MKKFQYTWVRSKCQYFYWRAREVNHQKMKVSNAVVGCGSHTGVLCSHIHFEPGLTLTFRFSLF